jgi:hypothetical protein
MRIERNQLKQKNNNIVLFVGFAFVLFYFLNSCKKNTVIRNIEAIDEKENEKLFIVIDSVNKTTCIYVEILDSFNPKVKEIIYLDSLGRIDSNNSNYVEIKDGDLYYHSPYDFKGLKMGVSRTITFYGNDSINGKFDNLDSLSLINKDFNENGVIKNYKKEILSKGLIEEKIVLDTIIKSEKGNKRIIRKLNLYIDLDDLLINRVENTTR